MTTATKTNITVEIHKGNFIAGCDQETIDAVKLDASVELYTKKCDEYLKDYSITWDIRNDEGREYISGDDGRLDDDDKDDIHSRMEQVFAWGEFWVNN